MSEWLYEAGIGEARAALVEDGRIVQAAIELTGTLTVGTVAEGRLVELLPGRQGRVTLAQGGDVLLAPVPKGMTQGSALTVIVTREAIPERGRSKLPKAQVAPEDAVPAPGPDLRARIAATGLPVRDLLAHQPDDLEAAGWSELLDEAGSLRSLTSSRRTDENHAHGRHPSMRAPVLQCGAGCVMVHA